MARLPAFLDGFIIAKQAEGCSPRTIEHYRYHLSGFASHIDGRPVEEVTATDIREWLVDRQREHSAHTVHGDYRSVKAFFNWLEAEDLIETNPVRRVKSPRVPETMIKTFEPHHIEDLLSLCDRRTFLGCRNRALILLLLDTGLRRQEMASLTLADVEVDRRSIRVMGKGRKERAVPFGVECQKALWRYLLRHPRHHDRLWLTEENRPLESIGIRTMLNRLGKRAHVSGVRCSAHTFRHTFAVTYLRNGGDPFTLQYLLGHSTLKMTRHYSQALNADDAARVHALASPVDSLLGSTGNKETPKVVKPWG